MSIALVSSSFSDVGVPGLNVTVTIPSTTAGNLLVIAVGFGTTSATIVGCHDTSGNAFTQATNSTTPVGGNQADLWYLENCAGGQVSVTVNFSTTVAHIIYTAWEFSGAKTSGSFDSANNLQTTAATTSPILTPSVAGELLVSCAYTDAFLLTSISAPWITDQADPGVVNGYASGHLINPALSPQQGIYNPTTSNAFGSTIAGFLPATTNPSQTADMFLVF